MALPAELWNIVLRTAGPLSLAPSVGIRDVRDLAATRLQRAVRAILIPTPTGGAAVRVQFRGWRAWHDGRFVVRTRDPGQFEIHMYRSDPPNLHVLYYPDKRRAYRLRMA